MNKLKIWITAALAALVLVTAAACSDDSSSDDDADDSATASETTADPDGSDEPDDAGDDATDSGDAESDDAEETTEPDDDGPDTAPSVSDDFCENVQSMIDSLNGFFESFTTNDYADYVEWAQGFAPLGQAVLDTAPGDLQDEVDLAVGPFVEVATRMAELDPSDEKAINDAFNEPLADAGPENDRAGKKILKKCGIDPASFGTN